jgi:hypothetical protein
VRHDPIVPAPAASPEAPPEPHDAKARKLLRQQRQQAVAGAYNEAPAEAADISDRSLLAATDELGVGSGGCRARYDAASPELQARQ